MKEIVTRKADNDSREPCGIKIRPCKYAVAQTGYLVSATEFEFVSLWRFYCLHCNRPVNLVMAHGLQPAHFIHVADDLSDIAGTCPFVLKM
ncbi:hypothetical protein OIP52_000621 [Salmonella enterica]|nr:hypothetical protein [Salmonella enterica]